VTVGSKYVALWTGMVSQRYAQAVEENRPTAQTSSILQTGETILECA
jgi:hypothetical protein